MSAANVTPWSDTGVRLQGIGSSDAAAAVGVDPYRSRLQLYMEKIGLLEREPAGEAAEWGTILEPTLLRQLAIRERAHVLGRDDAGEPVVFTPGGRRHEPWPESIALLGTLRHTVHPWMFAHLDAVLLEDDLRTPCGWAEAKTAGHYAARQWGEGADEIPEPYLVQTHHAAEILRARGMPTVCRVPVLLAGQRWRVYPIHPDVELIAAILEAEAEFWGMVERREPPPATAQDADTLRRLYPRSDNDRVLDADAALTELASALAAARARKDQVQGDVEGIEVAIKEAMATAAVLQGDGWKITWKSNRDSEVVDWRAVAAALVERFGVNEDVQTDIIGRHMTLRPGARVFRAYGLEKLGGTADGDA